MAATFRIGKIEDYASNLRIRITVMKNQLKDKDFESKKEFILGEIKATELILEEIINEFGLKTSEDDYKK
ncbi:hypothetical protein BME96_19025 (plasmid) [Virgibacillus halodenitrificans]|uniref:Uncharacterized protein n=1 Tax=Virgibacillus halodenitrificans TaxID=1482 RepID=A0AAC9NMA7_VIRHA|nr:hypothetical protein [Virgibacillus halodenitrificans]APC50377.1 hypothetical protein BME96_19025 [Virgibacillus halodenitrificans]CDQ37692.1 hypothetical protein BN993_07254 [Virgibacillus halodenitrificans]